MDYKYKPGDAVRVRSDLKYNTNYFMWSGPKPNTALIAVSNMVDLAGKIVHISEYSASGEYRVEEDSERWRWTDEMFEDSTNGISFQSLL